MAASHSHLSILDAALDYHARGWSIIPTKHRSKESLGAWKPDLAATLPTAITGRRGGGRHVYACADPSALRKSQSGFIDLGDGELRLSGCYCVLPPSTHETGRHYDWLVPPAATVPLLTDLGASGFLPPMQQRATERTETTETTQTTDDNPGNKGNGGDSSARAAQPEILGSGTEILGSGTDILRAIHETLPTGPGKRHKQVFELARALKALPALADAPVSQMKPYVRWWHELAKPHIMTQWFDETWTDFLRAWPRVKFPRGVWPMDEVFQRACKAPLPPGAEQFDNPDVRLLVAFCRELQRMAGDGPFFLACRTAGRLFKVEHTTAWRWLFLLEEEKVIVPVERGGKGMATRYRYLGG